MITFHNIHKVFKTDFWAKDFVALEDVSFSLPEGKVMGFLGANGAGKTTCLKILMDFIQPTSGEVVFDESLGRTRQEIFGKIGYLPERPYFYPHLTGNEFLKYMAALSDVKSSGFVARVKKWAPRFSIEFALNRKINTYSKGMLQRLGFVAALVHNPLIVIFDEPLSGLDPIGRKDVKEAILELCLEGKTVFFSSHIVADVEEICQSVVFLEKGKVLYEGSIDKLILDNMKNEFVLKLKRGLDLSRLSGEFKILDERSNEHFVYCQVGGNGRDEFLKSCLEVSGEVLAIEQERMSLEEIFYQVKNTEREVELK